jgi:hypothetical protein
MTLRTGMIPSKYAIVGPVALMSASPTTSMVTGDSLHVTVAVGAA